MQTFSLFATCPRGVEPLLVTELTALGGLDCKERKGGVAFQGDLETAYRACLWSRLASRILLPLSTFAVPEQDALYAGARAVDWTSIFSLKRRFAIEVAGRSPVLTHTHYAGLRVKDAIADCFRDKLGARPDVDTERPDIRIHVHLDRQQATLSLDLSGDSLHRRGYRSGTGEAPLKENLAAALLWRAGWPEIARAGGALLDPMCGSGTLVIEAGLMAGDVAPGIWRMRYGFEAWTDHQPPLWQRLRAEAEARRSAGLAGLPLLAGSDIDGEVLRHARQNADRAGLAGHIEWRQCDVSEARPPAGQATGLLVTNPPYGERLGAESEIIKLYSLLGAALKQHFAGWNAAVFTGRPDLAPRLGLRAKTLHTLYNGALECKLLRFELATRDEALPAAPAGGEDFANRLRKNLKHLGKWAKRTGVANYRAYDADLPDYAIAVDLYHASQQQDALHVHVQEYAAPDSIDPIKAEKRLREALVQLQAILEVPASRIHYRLRKSQKGTSQYQKQDDQREFLAIEEHGVKLWVNFDDYLDTGLFLDHRPMRLRLQREAAGKRFLNLFCYTGSATAHAVHGGASASLSIDLSNTYLSWAQRNLMLNGVGADFAPARTPHQLLRADCLLWLREQASMPRSARYDLIFCDPPTFSNSKKMEGVLDTQADHVELIQNCAALLAPGGRLYFSTNRRRFKLDQEALAGLRISEITPQTLDEDFKRPPPAHRCWLVENRSDTKT